MGAESKGWSNRARAFLHGLIDARRHNRHPGGGSDKATLNVRAKDHDVAVLDISASGAMVTFDGLAREGDPVILQLSDHGAVGGQVRWVREGKAGIYFTQPLAGFAKGANVGK